MTWAFAIGDQVCGYCGAIIPPRSPLLLLTAHRLVRCVGCARDRLELEPPDSIESPPPVAVPTVQPTVLVTPAQWVHDFKLAQSGER
jgi:hypothetical protein